MANSSPPLDLVESSDAPSPDASEDLGHESTPDSAPATHKRRRLNGRGGTRPRPSDSRVASQSRESTPSTSLARRGASSSTMTHQPGQIVRVEMENFVTYTHAVVYPGPSLNMVIGPNGTGKSTLVCAICLGLGNSPGLMGRAKEPTEYIKTGKGRAHILIELKGHHGQPNVVVERTITRSDGKSIYFVEEAGAPSNHAKKPVPKKRVEELVKGFNIQIENLCNFLPQDRVVEFSMLTHVQRFQNTLEAVAPVEIKKDFEDLKTLRQQQRTQGTEQAQLERQLESRRRKQDEQRDEVERMRSRQEMLEQQKMLKKLRPFAVHNDNVRAAKEARNHLRLLIAENKRIEAELNPLKQIENQKRAYLAKIEEVRKNRQREVLASARACKMHKEKRQKVEEKINKAQSSKTALVREQGNRRADMDSLAKDLQRFKDELARGEPETDIASLNSQIRDLDRQITDVEREVREINDRRADLQRQIAERKNKITATTAHIETLQSVAGQRQSTLEGRNREAAQAWDIVKRNMHIFSGPVYGPAALECSVKDSRFVGALEAAINEAEFTAITATSMDDFRKLDHLINAQHKLRKTTIRTSLVPLDSPELLGRRISDDQARAIGIKQWAIDLIQGPPAVLAMLAENARLHLLPAFDQSPGEEMLGNITQADLPGFLTPQEVLRITRRKDIAGAQPSTTSRHPGKPKWWVDEPVNNNRVAAARQSLRELESELEELTEQERADKASKQAKDAELTRLREEKEPLVEEKGQQLSRKRKYDGLPNRIESIETKLADKRTQAAEHEQRLYDVDQEEMRLHMSKGQTTLDLCANARQLQAYMTELLHADLYHTEAQSDITRLEEEQREANATLLAKEAERGAAADTYNALRGRMDQSARELNDGSREMRIYYNGLPDEERLRTLEQLNEEIDAMQTRLEMLSGGNESLIAEFERRAREIEQFSERLANFLQATQQLAGQIQQIRSRFEPFVENMTEQISTAFAASFAKINCSGAVELGQVNGGENGAREERVDKGDDFDRWEMRILVSFREESEMQLLDSQRQSGGERSISTIFFLMALQSLSTTPFRIVDEINQGMDPRNERIVHGRLVGIACGEDVDGDGEGNEAPPATAQASQYFLVTPKLLPGLYYARGMKVHVINSGEHMPTDPGALSIRSILDRAKASSAGGPSSGSAPMAAMAAAR